jgi:hypothetical protein
MMVLKRPTAKILDADPQELLTIFRTAIETGMADTFLPDLYDLVYARIQWYQSSDGYPLPPDFYEALQLQRKFREPTEDLVVGRTYALLGDAYRDVQVQLVAKALEDGRCTVAVTQTGAVAGFKLQDTYRVPSGALVPLGGAV